ncbi:hypothetical protein ABT300_16295 [Streptomyces sp. NPDC001027]|uniref:hypothetical protein n=1 Tax=Streptomyces sp. NPDC001027 TaxID=3154771 RepID=UPI00331F40F2
MLQVLIAGIAVAVLVLSGLVVLVLALTVRIWKTWWARTAHVAILLTAAAALALGIQWVVHAMPPGGCAHHHAGHRCVTTPGD